MISFFLNLRSIEIIPSNPNIPKTVENISETAVVSHQFSSWDVCFYFLNKFGINSKRTVTTYTALYIYMYLFSRLPW